MARIRSLKPEIWMSPQVMNLSHSARLLFIGLITQADDEGRGTSDPRRLKAAIFGGDDETSSSIRRWLDEIQQQGLVALYEASPHGVLFELTGWRSHQKIDRAKQSAYPAPPSGPQRRLFDESSSSARRGSDGSDLQDRIGSEGIGSRTHDQSSSSASEGKSDPGSEGQPNRRLLGADEWRKVDGIDDEAMQGWIDHRVTKAKPLTPGECIAAAKMLAGMGKPELQRAAVLMASGNGWMNLRPADGKTAAGSDRAAKGTPGWKPDPEEERQFQERLTASQGRA